MKSTNTLPISTGYPHELTCYHCHTQIPKKQSKTPPVLMRGSYYGLCKQCHDTLRDYLELVPVRGAGAYPFGGSNDRRLYTCF